MEKLLFTSESVTEGHPDKICDQISDAILDALMEKDPMSRVACEVCTTTGLILVMGEITTNAYVDIQKIARETVREMATTARNTASTATPAASSWRWMSSPPTLPWALIRRWRQRKTRCPTTRSRPSEPATRE